MPGGGGGGEMRITRATKSCHLPISGVGGLCMGSLPRDLNCSDISTQANQYLASFGQGAVYSSPRELQQCPTSGSEYRTIVECRLPAPGGGIFYYWTEALDAESIEALRTGCELVDGTSFHTHKQQQPEPEPEPDTFTLTNTDTCNDGRPVEFRLFEQIGDVTPSSRRHPGGNQVLVTRELGQAGITRISCQAGTNICYGGRVRGTSNYFGVGVDGSEGCTDCCTPCGSTRTVRFGCG